MGRALGLLLAFGVVVTTAAAVRSEAQEANRPTDRDLPLERVVARALLDVLPEADDDVFARSWYAVGVRAQRFRWHLAEPIHPERIDEPMGVRRTGWIPARGRSAPAILCGDRDTVRAARVRLAGSLGGPDAAASAPSGLVQALAAEDVEVFTEEGFAQAPSTAEAYGGSVFIGAERYRLVASGKSPAWLWSGRWCTSPKARAAQGCWTDFLLSVKLGTDAASAFAADEPIVSECRLPGRD